MSGPATASRCRELGPRHRRASGKSALTALNERLDQDGVGETVAFGVACADNIRVLPTLLFIGVIIALAALILRMEAPIQRACRDDPHLAEFRRDGDWMIGKHLGRSLRFHASEGGHSEDGYHPPTIEIALGMEEQSRPQALRLVRCSQSLFGTRSPARECAAPRSLDHFMVEAWMTGLRDDWAIHGAPRAELEDATLHPSLVRSLSKFEKLGGRMLLLENGQLTLSYATWNLNVQSILHALSNARGICGALEEALPEQLKDTQELERWQAARAESEMGRGELVLLAVAPLLLCLHALSGGIEASVLVPLLLVHLLATLFAYQALTKRTQASGLPSPRSTLLRRSVCASWAAITAIALSIWIVKPAFLGTWDPADVTLRSFAAAPGS